MQFSNELRFFCVSKNNPKNQIVKKSKKTCQIRSKIAFFVPSKVNCKIYGYSCRKCH